MSGNVMSWGVALGKGYEPRLYSYEVEHVPVGEYEAVLDFKIWAKKAMAISCYFTALGSGNKFQLTVYCQRGTGFYKIKGCDIDFTQCPLNRIYLIKVVMDIINEKRKVSLVKAELTG